MDLDKIKSESQGKWPGIFERLGIHVGNGSHGPCPVCNGVDRFRFDDKNGAGTWFCNVCTPKAGDGFALIMKVLGCDFKEALKTVADLVGHVEKTEYQEEKPIDASYFRKILEKSHKTKPNDIVHKYLKSRGLNSIPNDLWTGMSWEPETKKYQHTMFVIFSIPNEEAVTMHRTWLDQKTYGKLPIKKPKKFFPTLKKTSGGAIRLFDYENELGVAEGIETAIAVYQKTGLPCWATIGTSLLESFEPPKGIKSLTIFGDNDKNYAGQKAAYTLANRLVLKNELNVDVVFPLKQGTDFLDEINS